jgi:hypothetical protein
MTLLWVSGYVLILLGKHAGSSCCSVQPRTCLVRSTSTAVTDGIGLRAAGRLLMPERMRTLSLLAFLAAALVGCATSDRHLATPARGDSTVVFPSLALRNGEFIEEFKIRIKGGRVSAIQRIPDDWNFAVEREDGSCVMVHGEAGHFSGGLPSFDRLNGAIVVPAEPDIRIQAVVTTDRTDSPGGGGRKIPFRHLELRGQPSAGSRPAARLSPFFHFVGTVVDAQSGKAIPEFRVTPRYAFLGKAPPVHGAWDEYEAELFRGGSFDLAYDHPLLVGSLDPPGWQFLVEAEGYEPFVTQVVGHAEQASLDCRMKPTICGPRRNR